ncbi:helix-turn-helix domain-containing protein [Furfurilactobacillus milii]|uniref:Helix-turn-helix domain-containing protein n=1 Tax=Furfurilactobacillus milii TaxID=2888272 RepID=A0A6N9HZP2_9LACO|nr:helix-turn-helix domain-containing protein [Furfurilactobacillus milii]
MIDGSIIRKKRRSMHLSQRDLAANITTQTTISNLENSSGIPNSELFNKILRRLGLSMDDVFTEDTAEPGPYLSKADDASKNFDHQGVLDILKKIEPNENFTDEDTLHYDFLKADAEMWLTKDYMGAIFNYNKMQEFARNKTDLSIYSVLAVCQLGTAYYYSERVDSAIHYFNELPKLLEQIDIENNLYWTLFIMDNLTNFWSKQHEFKKSIDFGQRALEITEKYHTIDFADTLSFTVGENYAYLKGWDNKKAQEYLAQSYFLVKYTGSKVAQKVIKERLTEHHISFQW